MNSEGRFKISSFMCDTIQAILECLVFRMIQTSAFGKGVILGGRSEQVIVSTAAMQADINGSDSYRMTGFDDIACLPDAVILGHLGFDCRLVIPECPQSILYLFLCPVVQHANSGISQSGHIALPVKSHRGFDILQNVTF